MIGFFSAGAMGQGGGGGGGAYFDEVMADNPTLYLRLNELTGDPVNHGSVTLTSSSFGSTTRGQTSLCGDADDYSVLANGSFITANFASGAILPANNFTMECLINPANVVGLKAIMSGGVPGCPYFRLSNNQIQFLRSQAELMGTFSSSISADTRYLIGVDVASDGTTTFYLNGVADGTASPFASFPANSAVYAGREAGVYDNFVGLIDEVAIYHTAIGATRHAAHAAAAGL